MKPSGDFRRLFLPITLSFFLTVMAVSAFFVLYMDKKVVQTIYTTEARNLEKAARATELLIHQAATLALQVHNDYQVKRLLFYEHIGPIEQMISLEQLKSYWYVIPSLHSIYLYNVKRDTFYLATGAKVQLVQERDEFFDFEALRILDDRELVNSGRPVHRRAPTSGAGVYTFIYNFLGGSTDNPVSVIVVNIRESWLRDQIGLLGFSDAQTTVAVDEERALVLGGDRNAVPRIDDVLDAVGSGRRQGYLLARGVAGNDLVAYYHRSDLGWTFIRSTPCGDLLEPLRVIRVPAVSTSAGFVLLTLLISFLLSRRIYVPFSEMISRKEQLEHGWGEASAAINRELLRSYLLEPRRNELPDVDYDVLARTDELPSGLRALYEIPLSIDIRRAIHTIMFALDPQVHRRDEHGGSRDEFPLRDELARIREILGEHYPCEVFLFRGGVILALVNATSESGTAGLRRRVAKAVAALARDLDASFSAAYDPAPTFIWKVNAALGDLEDALEDRLIHGPGSCIDVQAAIERRRVEVEVTSGDVDEIMAAINEGRFDDVASLCATLLHSAARGSHRAVRSTAVRLISILNHAVASMATTIRVEMPLSFSSLLRDVERCSSVSELEQFFASTLRSVRAGIDKESDSRSTEIVLAIKRVIRNRYDDRNLSSIVISEELGLSAPYVGRVFKRETGKSLPDFINVYRTERAKELLVTNELPVQSIMDATGYNSTSNFHSVFRRLTGTTPAAYRFKHRPAAARTDTDGSAPTQDVEADRPMPSDTSRS